VVGWLAWAQWCPGGVGVMHGHVLTVGSNASVVSLGVGSGGPDEGDDQACSRGRGEVVNSQVYCKLVEMSLESKKMFTVNQSVIVRRNVTPPLLLRDLGRQLVRIHLWNALTKAAHLQGVQVVPAHCVGCVANPLHLKR